MRVLWRTVGLGIGVFSLLSSWGRPADAQCDPTSDWALFGATGEIREVLVRGNEAWVAAEGGVIRIDLTTVASGNPVQRKLTEEDGLVSPDITCMTIDTFGNVWVGTRFRGVSIFDANGNHLRNLDSFDNLWSDLIVAMAPLDDRVYVQSSDEYTPAGGLVDGGFVPVTVTQLAEGGFDFSTIDLGSPLEIGSTVFTEPDSVWFGTAGNGLWLRSEAVGDTLAPVQILTEATGLLSNNIGNVLRGPDHDGPGSVLWLGGARGLQAFDAGAGTIDTLAFFQDVPIQDLYLQGNDLYVVSTVAPDSLRHNLFRVDLTAGFNPVQVPRIDCGPDTLYTPREAAADAAGRVVLGSILQSFAVRENGAWTCPPPLGPHSPEVSDLALTSAGDLYFTAGRRSSAARGNGAGFFDGLQWGVFTPTNSGLLDLNASNVVVWPDDTVWFGTTQSATFGGVSHYFPETGQFVTYRNGTTIPENETLGRNVWGMEMDAASNLWIVYGQVGGGLSVVEYPGLQVTNYPISTYSNGTDLLRDVAFDSQGRLWISTANTLTKPGRIYMIDTRGTLRTLSDDLFLELDVATEVLDLGEILKLEIDSQDRIWAAGALGLGVGQIGSGSLPNVTWERVDTPSRLGPRTPRPYLTAELDWEENLWVGTFSEGLVRLSGDGEIWTWYDQVEGCPLPDQTVAGLYADHVARVLYVGTASGGIATVRFGAGVGGDANDPQPYPNPWNPNWYPEINFGGIGLAETTDLRIYTLAGELVWEGKDLRGAKTWDGRNQQSTLVDAGIYFIRAVSTGTGTGEQRLYEGKVAIIR